MRHSSPTFLLLPSSCFQVVSDESVVDQEMSERLLDFSERPELKRLLDQYDVVKVEVSSDIRKCPMYILLAKKRGQRLCETE